MHGFRRILSLVLALSVALMALSGCSGAAKPKVDDKPVELTLLMWPGTSREAIDEVIFEYGKKHPNVRVRVKEFDRSQLLQGVMGGGGGSSVNASLLDGVDIALLPRAQAAELATAGLLRDLSAVRLPQFNDAIADLFDDLSRLDGKRIGLPFDFTPSMMTINDRIFETSGVKLPPTDWTVQEFEQTLQALKSAGQTVQINPSALLAPIVGAFGGQVYDAHTQRWMLDTDEAKQGLAYIARLAQGGLISAESSGSGRVVIGAAAGGAGGRGGFAGGPAIAALPSGFNLRGLIGGGGGGLAGGQQVYPKGTRGRSVPTSATMVVVAASSNQGEVAMDFAREMLNESAQVALAKGGIRPVIASSKALAAWQDVVGDKAAQIQETSLQGAHADLGVNYTEVLQALTPYFEGTVTLDQVLPDLLAKLN